MSPLRRQLARQVRGLVGSGEIDLTRPPGDPGLFGPESMTWRVHGDFLSMMVGGTASLLVQMLHPAALAGVWDHSDFLRDSTGRLRRTAQFLSVTTFGSTNAAERAIARVRAIHARVTGILPDGTAYRADDPALLTWVHAAEVDAFLRSYLRHRDPTLSPARQDQYLEEMAEIARRLGATAVPASRAALARYFEEVRPTLRADERTRRIAALLLRRPTASLTAAPFGHLVKRAAIDLMPGWAAAMHGFERPVAASMATRIGAQGAGRILRWALSV